MVSSVSTLYHFDKNYELFRILLNKSLTNITFTALLNTAKMT